MLTRLQRTLSAELFMQRRAGPGVRHLLGRRHALAARRAHRARARARRRGAVRGQAHGPQPHLPRLSRAVAPVPAAAALRGGTDRSADPGGSPWPWRHIATARADRIAAPNGGYSRGFDHAPAPPPRPLRPRSAPRAGVAVAARGAVAGPGAGRGPRRGDGRRLRDLLGAAVRHAGGRRRRPPAGGVRGPRLLPGRRGRAAPRAAPRRSRRRLPASSPLAPRAAGATGAAAAPGCSRGPPAPGPIAALPAAHALRHRS